MVVGVGVTKQKGRFDLNNMGGSAMKTEIINNLKKGFLTWSAGLLFFGMLFGVGEARMIRPLSMGQMLSAADRVFVGVVERVGVEKSQQGEASLSVTYFRVILPIKGVVTKEVRLAQITFGAGFGQAVPASGVGFKKGEEVLLFLHGESAAGLSSPVAFGLGKMAVVKDKTGTYVQFTSEQRQILFRSMGPSAIKPFLTQGDSGNISSVMVPKVLPLNVFSDWLKGGAQ